MIDKEIDKLRDMETELMAMQYLQAESEIIKQQKHKIDRQRKKIGKMVDEMYENKM